MTALKFKDSDSFALTIVVGDRNKDGTLDATVVVHADLPFDGAAAMRELSSLGPFNMPAAELPEFVATVYETFAPYLAKLVKFARRFT